MNIAKINESDDRCLVSQASLRRKPEVKEERRTELQVEYSVCWTLSGYVENKDEKFVNLIGDLQEQFEREKLGFTLSMNQTKTDLADVRNGLQIFRYFDYKGIGKKKTVELWVGFNTTIWRSGIWVDCHIKPNTPNDIIKKFIRASYYLSYYRQGPSYERTIQKVGRVWLKNLKKSKNG